MNYGVYIILDIIRRIFDYLQCRMITHAVALPPFFCPFSCLRLVFFGNAIESTISRVTDKSGGFGNERLHLAPDAFTPLHYADVNASWLEWFPPFGSKIRCRSVYILRSVVVSHQQSSQFCMLNIFVPQPRIDSVWNWKSGISKEIMTKWMFKLFRLATYRFL